jgi:hypothetical protein
MKSSTNLIMAHRCRSGAVHPNNPGVIGAPDGPLDRFAGDGGDAAVSRDSLQL